MATVTPITIAIADEYEFTRHMLRCFLSDDSAIAVTIEASNVEELIEKLQRAETISEICRLDIIIAVKNGHDTMDVLRLRWPKLKELVFTIHSYEFAVINMLKKGAFGYIMKSAHPSDFFTAIKHIHEHGFFNSEIMNSQVVRMREAPNLNEREIEFLKHCCDDIPYKETG